MENSGEKIKYYRKKQQLTQGELAKEIISVSYLSKIENGTAIPSSEVIGMIYDRLGIERSCDLYTEEKHQKLCEIWFQHLFNNDKEKMIDAYRTIKDCLHLISDNKLITMIDIHKLRFYILIQEYDKAKKQYQSLTSIHERFNKMEMYYFYKFSGYYHFTNLSYHKAFTCLKDAESYLAYAFYQKDAEPYSLYYMIALAASHTRQMHITLTYSDKALAYYQKNYSLKQCAQCHVLIGLTYTRLKDYEQAKHHYRLAETIVENLNEKSLLATILQNKGNLYANLGEHDDAIEYYLKSYQIRKDASKQIVPVSSLMKLYYNNGDVENARKWLEKGLHLIENHSLENYVHIHEFTIYEQLLNRVNNASFQDIILNNIIPFLEEKELHTDKLYYLQILAEYLYENRKYKSSADFYKMALNLKTNL